MIGRVSAKIKRFIRSFWTRRLAAIDFLRPGVTTMQADRVARDVIEKAGFGKQFGHGLGHGIGREIHELPSLRHERREEELRPGMIVTVEPGIYLPGEGGVRIEDDVLITHSGLRGAHRRSTRASKDVISNEMRNERALQCAYGN